MFQMGRRFTGRVRSVCVLLFVALWVTHSVAAADRQQLKTFLEVTGFDVALDSIALNAVDAPAMLGMSANDFTSNWKRATEDVFAQEKLHSLAYEILDQTLSDTLLTHAVDFYGSDLGQRLVVAENISHMMEDNDAKQEKGAALIADASDARIAELTRLAEAVDSAGSAIAAVQEVQVRFLMAASHAGVLDDELDEGMLRALLKQSETELRATLKLSNLNNGAYSYREFSDEDISDYADALEHPLMQQVYQLMNAILFEVTAQRFEELAVRMADLQSGESL